MAKTLFAILMIGLWSSVRCQDGLFELGTSDFKSINGGSITDMDSGGNSIIVRNTGISVNHGREHAIDPATELTINVQPGDRCVIHVLQNDPLSQLPGRLTPSMFPCDFGPGDVKYVHFGSRKPPVDRVKLQLTYSTETDTFIIPFVVEVRVQSKQLEIVTRAEALNVEELMGDSDIIDSNKVEFSYDSGAATCHVTILNGNSGLPRYGEVVNLDPLGQMVDCNDFLNLGIYYRHTASTSSPRNDYIPAYVELRDLAGNAFQQEYFQIMVRIRNGLQNTPPTQDLQAMMIMEVDQFVMTALTRDILSASDVETPSEQIVFNITSPFGPGEGYIVSTDDRNLPLSSFTQGDIEDLKIAYVPPADDSDEQRIFSLELEAVDADLATSAPFELMIVVKPKNTLAPVATRNTGIQLFEGQSRVLRPDLNLEISDEDNLDDVVIAPIAGLRRGRLLVRGVQQKFFTIDDLREGVVTYHHDGTDSYSDNIIFRMTDGSNEVEFLFPVTIAPLDDEPPVVTVNTGVLLNEREAIEISEFILAATDIDSDDLTIRFILEEPYSSIGEFVYRQTEQPADPQNWIFDGTYYEQRVTEWLYADILSRNIYYRHVGPHNSDVVMDRIPFRVADSNFPPNLSPVNEFIAKIMPVDTEPPYLYPRTTLEMTVDEFEVTEILKKYLRYTDDDSIDRDLLYIITIPPMDLDTNTALTDAGSLVYTDRPEVQVLNFTQGEINHLKISYRPPARELGITPRQLQFQFAVSDPQGNSVRDQQFNIFLRPVDNKPPTVTNPGFNIDEGSQRPFDRTILDLADVDTPEEELTITLRTLPYHGTLLKNGVPMAVGDSFTMQDIDDGNIVFVNNGAEETSDRINFDVSDGVHTVPVIMHIGIIPIDDEAPTLDLPPGSIGSFLEVLEGQSSIITSNVLSATDVDSEDLMITFIINDFPTRGLIERNGFPVQRFTQSDIINGLISYRHNGDEIGMTSVEDSLNLTISDMADDLVIDGKTITRITVYVTILPNDNEPPTVEVSDPLTVDEGGKNTLTLNNINASDVDTMDDDILCTILTPPEHGYLENISPAPGSEKSRAGLPISSFTLLDIKLGHINYVQTIHQNAEPDEDTFLFQCTDGQNITPNLIFPIDILSGNDEVPELYTNMIIVEEGMEIAVNEIYLSATDADEPPDELHFFLIDPPKHGTILYTIGPNAPFPATNFTVDQLNYGGIVYLHDGSETTEDSFSVHLTDGTHEVSGEVPIRIISQDDETPRVTINDGIYIEIGESKVITNRILKSTDLDSPDSNLTYIIRFGPEQGVLQRLDKEDDSIVVANITVGMNFTQWELDNQRIRYVNTGGQGGRDLIKFDVTDGTNPLIDRYFYVTIEHEDNVHPDVINAGATLPEGGRITLTTDILRTSDLNSPDEDLLFRITSTPEKGQLESTDRPGVAITEFTQLDLAGNKIIYVHTSKDEMKMDSFQFEVTDGLNTVVRTFRIMLTDVDNQYPVVTMKPLVVKEAGNKLITPYELRVTDADTPDTTKLVFSVTQLPVHGTLMYNNTRPVSTFSMEDIYNNLITYQHDGSETTEDSFSFTVTDGTHDEFYVQPELESLTSSPQRVPITIVSVDNGQPQVLVNRGAPTIMDMGGGMLGFMFTNKFLMAEDRDSDNDNLLYVINTPPQYGYLVNINMGNVSISNFTQADINSMSIKYILEPGVNATSDSFSFDILDGGNNKLPEQVFRLNWAFISLEREYYEVNETDKYLEVKLRRRGYLGETSFVGIQTADGTATSPVDFKGKSARQVQFNPGQTEGFWRVKIIDDNSFEQGETFEIVLHDPVMGALEFPDRAVVRIMDYEDESTVNIDLPADFTIEEDVGELVIPIRRSGDLSEEFMAICSTMPDTATGSDPSPVMSFSDYISRLEEDPDNFVRFDKGEDLAYCRVLIIDDSLYEDDEQFQVKLSMPMGGRIGGSNSVNIIIAADSDDEPSFYFSEPEYSVDESGGFVEVQVWRTGTDLSQMASVTVRSRPSDPQSAVAGEDYTGISRNLDFAPGVTMQTVRVYIQDDLGQPRLEGEETFELVLRMPMNAVLGAPEHTVITINDSVSDLPTVQFLETAYEVNENDGSVTATIIRSGDLSIQSTVRCYTRQGSAQVMMDYDERPNAQSSVVTFLPGEREQECTVLMMDDDLYEEDEQFRLVLGDPRTGSGLQAKIGAKNESVITVHDVGDKPIIKFAETTFTVDEPTDPDGVAVVNVPVVRMGDTSQVSIVRVFTKDGSARSGIDYNPLSKDLEFGVGVSEHIVEIEVLPDRDTAEMREAFTLHLTMDQMMIAEIQMDRALIYIEQDGQRAGVTFPSAPYVVSLVDYDDPSNPRENPPRGYPVVCISACNSKHPDYETTGVICENEGLNDTLTQFRWMVSGPTSDTGVTSPLRQVDSDTFFTSTKTITLDSIYFGPGSRVQCVARPVSINGDPGREAASNIVEISKTDGMCMPRDPNEIGAEPFSARLRYTGPGDEDYPNKVKLTVTMPHIDGLLPAISTRQLSNFELALSKDGYRIGTHRCSNLLDYNEIPTDFGFINEETKNPNVIGEVVPYQFDGDLRGDQTLRFYRNLNLESCLWEFTTYYDMSELLEECGGIVGSDGQVLDLVQSYVSMRVPLYVSYIFYSPGATGGWQHFDQQSQLQLTFVYDTSILWQNGIGAESTDSSLSGNLYPTSMRIDENGRLVVNFRTEALFNGLFVEDHPTSSLSSSVISADHPGLTYTLTLVRSEPTFAQPEQIWQFVSDNAISDYSGEYTIRLIPCSTSPNQAYDIPPVCNPQQPVVFDLPIRFQQVSDPVPAEFSLSTDFLLLSKEALWLSDGSMGFSEDADAAFLPGDIIYGRVHVDPVQNVGSGFNMQIEKVFLCSGRDGYIPKYDPQNGEYGCVADTPNLLYAFKILDFRAPDTVNREFNGISFDAQLAIDNPNGLDLVRQAGADGFTMSTNPLYEVDAGRRWYLHAIYSMRSSDGSNIFKRDAVHAMSETNSRKRRALKDVESVGKDMGTNMHVIRMQGDNALEIGGGKGIFQNGFNSNETGENSSMITIVAVIGIVGLILLVVLIVAVVLRRKNNSGYQAPRTVAAANGGSRVVTRHSGDNTEV